MAWGQALGHGQFRQELDELLGSYAGRPTPLTLAERFAPGKRLPQARGPAAHRRAQAEQRARPGAARARLGKSGIVAETGAGQHGVAVATACARFGLDCVVHMGAEDMRRQRPNVERMRLLGAEVQPVEIGTRTLKEATSEAVRDWLANVETTYYLIGSCVGPHPYPEIVRELQSVIGAEAREQILAAEGRLPEVAVACVGGGSNAIGLFAGFVDDDVRLVGVEAEGAASLVRGTDGRAPRSTLVPPRGRGRADPRRAFERAGPRLPRRRPEHAFLRDTGRAEYVSVDDAEALGRSAASPAPKESSRRSSRRTRSRTCRSSTRS